MEHCTRKCREEMKIRQIKRQRRRTTKFIANVLVLVTLIIWVAAMTNLQNTVEAKINDLTVKVDTIGQSIQNEEKNDTAEPQSLETISESERILIEKVVMSEASVEPIEGMMAVAQTIKDRSDLWNMTPTEVVNQPSQYASPYIGDVSSNVIQAVSAVFDEGQRIYEEPITHFYSGEKPYWTANKVDRGGIGKHRFYY